MADISIIVPIYNMEKYLNQCIDSLINQTKKELEFILVNDGSTDHSEEIILSYHDDRIKYFHNENRGIGKTRNFGIEAATGKYLMFLDSDDYLSTDACEILYEKAEQENLDMVVFDFYRVEDGKLKEVHIPNFQNSSLKENPKLLLDINLGPSNKLFKRNIIVENQLYFEEVLKYEDAPFIVSFLKYAGCIGKVDQSLHYYVIHKNSETTVRDERVFDILKIVDKIRNMFLDEAYIEDTLNTLIISILVNYNIQQRAQENHKVGMHFIDESFQYLKKYVPDYRKNSYFKSQSLLRSLIEKCKLCTKIYCSVYRLIHHG